MFSIPTSFQERQQELQLWSCGPRTRTKLSRTRKWPSRTRTWNYTVL